MFRILLNFLKDHNVLVVNEYSKPRGIQMAMSKDIKPLSREGFHSKGRV